MEIVTVLEEIVTSSFIRVLNMCMSAGQNQ